MNRWKMWGYLSLCPVFLPRGEGTQGLSGCALYIVPLSKQLFPGIAHRKPAIRSLRSRQAFAMRLTILSATVMYRVKKTVNNK